MYVELAAALGVSDTQPVGRLIARSEETRALTERLEQDRAQGVAAFPVVREAAVELREQVRGEIGDAYPRQDEEAGVVDWTLPAFPSTALDSPFPASLGGCHSR